jgi:hypothetical protein
MSSWKARKPGQLLVALTAAAAMAVAVPALGFAGPPVVSEPQPGDWCGVVPGTFVDTVVTDFTRDAGGNLIEHVRFTSLFTATATGKSIESSGANTTRSTGPIDNGDGTVSFVTQITGLALKFQIPNGPVLEAANGEPIRSAGVLSIEDIFDAATGDYITTTESFHGPHLVRQGVDICGPSVAYLLDP